MAARADQASPEPDIIGDLNLLSVLTILEHVTLCDWKAKVHRAEEIIVDVTASSIDVIASLQGQYLDWRVGRCHGDRICMASLEDIRCV